jgi:DNA-binding CsgD family transcriptional regulator
VIDIGVDAVAPLGPLPETLGHDREVAGGDPSVAVHVWVRRDTGGAGGRFPYGQHRNCAYKGDGDTPPLVVHRVSFLPRWTALRYPPKQGDTKVELLRVQDVRAAYRLIGECRDLGSDPVLWQARLFAGLSPFLGEAMASGGEGRLTGTRGAIVPLTQFHSGFEPKDVPTYLAYMSEGGPTLDPFIRAFPRTSGRAVTRSRRQLVSDRVYLRSQVFERYFQPGSVGHRLASVFPTAGGHAISLLHLHRSPKERDFSARERALLDFFHGEIGPLVGRALVSAAEPTPEGLPPRLRQTLICLVEGDTEKQAASRLGVSPMTLHEYVTALYRRFGVNSRGQLLAHVRKRAARWPWGGGLNV